MIAPVAPVLANFRFFGLRRDMVAAVDIDAQPRDGRHVNTQSRFIPIDKWQEAGHLWPDTEWAWRHLLRSREKNGLNACVVKVGRQILIDEARFLAWLAAHREVPE